MHYHCRSQQKRLWIFSNEFSIVKNKEIDLNARLVVTVDFSTGVC